MTGYQIRLTGFVDVPRERWEAVLAALPEHIRLSRAEPGCLEFNVAPDGTVPFRLSVSERFAGKAAFEAHQARLAGSDWAAATKGLPRHYRIREVAG